jgi:hypothetical protein
MDQRTNYAGNAGGATGSGKNITITIPPNDLAVFRAIKDHNALEMALEKVCVAFGQYLETVSPADQAWTASTLQPIVRQFFGQALPAEYTRDVSILAETGGPAGHR